jgi:hypothetical protein
MPGSVDNLLVQVQTTTLPEVLSNQCLLLILAEWTEVLSSSSPMVLEKVVGTDANRAALQSLNPDLMGSHHPEMAQTPSRAVFLNPWPQTSISSVAHLHQTD